MYSTANQYDEPTIHSRKKQLFKTIQIGDLYVLLDSVTQVQRFFKIVGNPKADSVAIAVGNSSYNVKFINREWVQKRIDRPTYFEPELQNLSPSFINNLPQSSTHFKIYRQEYPPDQFPLILQLLSSPLAVILLILTAFFIIWLADNSSFYLSSQFTWVSRVVLFGILVYTLTLSVIWVQGRGYFLYTDQGGLDLPFLIYSWANAIVETVPVFVLFQILKNRYFHTLKFEDQEFWKFVSILFLGILIQLLAVKVLAWGVPKYHIPAISYYSYFHSYAPLLKEFSVTWGIIAIGNFLNNLRKQMKELHQQTEQLNDSEAQVLASQSELDALQARVNPHFLYNSLNSIASLAQMNPAKTEEMALALSDFYKQSTNRQEQHWSTVGEERQLLATYLEIEKIRFGDRLQYNLAIEEDIDKHSIPRFLLQPLVENAIKYGFDKAKNVIDITIKVESIKEQLHIRILDSGAAFSGQMNTGYGLRSVKKKLKLLYPNSHELHFINEPSKQVYIVLENEKMISRTA